jgi:hypothetical protein
MTVKMTKETDMKESIEFDDSQGENARDETRD